nr:putative MFS transporter [uncultured bacterium]
MNRVADSIHKNESLGEVYERLVGDDEARFCKEIPESACAVVPGNFFIILAANFLTKLGDALVDAKTVLPWLLGVMAAPAVFTGLLVPLRESGSLLPQVFIGGIIRRLALRKWVWVGGSLVQALAVFAMALAALTLQGVSGAIALVAALVVFSLARGFCSIAAKDVLGKTVPKRRRGRVTGLSASLAGLVTLCVGALLVNFGQSNQQELFLLLLFIGGSLWLLAAICFSLIRESTGATEGGGNLIADGLKKFLLLRTDTDFRNLCITRSLMLSSALSAPYYVTLAREHSTALSLLGMLIIATGAAGLLSGHFWGKLADRSSRRVLQLTAVLTALSGGSVFCIDRYWEAAPAWIYVLTFFCLAVVHNGVRLGRKTYVVDMAEGNKRTDYVATSNTLIGGVLLLSGAIGFLTVVLDAGMMVLILALAALLAAVVASRLPDVSRV